MNQRIRHLTLALVVLLGILFVQLSNWQVVRRDDLVRDARNNSVDRERFDSPRGRIITCTGMPRGSASARTDSIVPAEGVVPPCGS